MAHRNQNSNPRKVPAAEFDDDPRADVGVTNKRPRFVGSSSRPQCPIEQLLIEEVDDSDPSSSSEGSSETSSDDEDLSGDEELDDDDEDEEGDEDEDTEEEEGEEEDTDGMASTDPSSGEANSGDGVAGLDVANTMMLTDKSLLDCPGCHKPLRAPIYQCENGHTACSTCCTKAINVCLSCTAPIGFIRNVAMEKLADSVLIYCKNTAFGCQEIMIYHKVVEHEQVCPHTACLCPHRSCSFTGSAEDLYEHFGARHDPCSTPFTYNTTLSLTVESNQKHVFLQERDEGVIFILNHDLRENNRTFSVDCIGPTTFNRMFVYQLTAKHMETCLSLQGVPEVFVKWEQHAPNKNYLTIPADFPDGNIDQFSIRICIKKAHLVE